MKVLLLLLWAFVVAESTLFPTFTGKGKRPNLAKLISGLFNPSQTNYSNVCVYSKEPSKFKPKCFLCPDGAYDAIDDEQLDGNVTYNQAACMEQNCGVRNL
ncbi:uncharacterized protein TNCV_3725871 [Trichonephila clavipes]|nr:uncharacterized protein TNCV_3725871 [Trichonephila clavipes]